MTQNKEYVVLNKELLNQCLKETGKLLKKKMKSNGVCCELIIVGGASIVLNYAFRLSTMDIDCTDENKIIMNDIVNAVAEKYNLPPSWINTDFMNTKSYSPKISQYSVFYGSYGNGVLEVRTIKDEYLLAMKVVSGRKYKNDYSDIYGIVIECSKLGKTITIEMLIEAITNLYGSLEVVDEKALEFAKKIIENPSIISQEEIRKMESNNASIIKAKTANSDEQADIEYILSKLDIN